MCIIWRKLTFLVMHHDVGKSPCKELSAEKKGFQLSQVVTELLRFEVGHSILAFENNSAGQDGGELSGEINVSQDGDQDHRSTIRSSLGQGRQ